MTSLKSLKLSGFRDAVRRLLRKTQSPAAADGSGSSSPAGGQHLEAEGSLLDGPANADAGSIQSQKKPSPLVLATLLQQDSIEKSGGDRHDEWSRDLHGDLSSIVQSHALDDESTIQGSITSPDSRTDGRTLATDDTRQHNLEETITPSSTDVRTTVTDDTPQHNLGEIIIASEPDCTMPPPATPLREQTRPTQKVPPPSQTQSWTPRQKVQNKENVPPEELEDFLGRLKIDIPPNKGETAAIKTIDDASMVAESRIEEQPEPEIDYSWLNDPVIAAERAQHMRFIGEALDMARLALRINETPVGCVLVHDGKVIAKGMNATNVTRNGTRHAEYMALAALFSYPKADGPRTTRLKPKLLTDREEEEKTARAAAGDEEAPLEKELPDAVSETLSTGPSPHEGNEDGSKGHLYPYGQKTIPIERVHRSIVSESTLYVTVEPCIMCASLLRQLKIKKVYFGAVNDKFGGTGGVFSLHANSLPVREDGQTASAHPIAQPIQLPDGTGGSLGVSFPPGGGDGGNVEQGYEIEGGWGRDDAVALLRRFYVQENGRAPVPRKKEGRAARLAAMMGQDGEGDGDGDADDDTVTPSEREDANGAVSDDVRAGGSSVSSFQEGQAEVMDVNGQVA